MSEPSNIVANLRLMARLVRDYDYAEISRMLREAADTITSLWNSLTVSEAALNKAAGNWAKADSQIRENGGRESNYERLFGTPERAARTLTHNTPSTCDECVLIDMCDIGMPATCMVRDCDALLEWLRGDAE